MVLRSTGTAPRRILDPALPWRIPDDEFAGLNLYNLGRGPDDVHLVGEGVGAPPGWLRFTRLDADTAEVLFTVHGQPGGPVLAVGGPDGGRRPSPGRRSLGR
ncbi:MAG: hypothetical protein R3F43_12885 [bacterium]